MLVYLDHFKVNLLIGWIRDFDYAKLEHVMKEMPFGEKEIDSCQFLDSRSVAGIGHLLFSAINALRAFESGNNISKKLGVEFLLFVSGQRQIKKAISMVGVKPETRNMTVVLLGSEKSSLDDAFRKLVQLTGGKVDDCPEMSNRDRLDELSRIYEIAPSEFESISYSSQGAEALEKLVIERVALLGIRH
jgi:tRNA threonylcarbamoyladenosine modification (KEOPS) complex Cgi121 subunit